MSGIAPGWYRDPVDPTIQRYWDGEGYLGEPISADVTPPPGPPADATPPPGPPAADATTPAPTPESPGPGTPTPAGVANSAPPVPHGFPVSAPSASPQSTPPIAPRSAPPHNTLPHNTPPGPYPPNQQVPGWPAYPRLVLPAPRPHGYRLAGLGARFIARFIDTLAVLGLNILINGYFVYQYYTVNLPYWQEISRRFYAGESMSGVEPPARSSTLLIIVLILAAALWFAYEVPSHANTGQTLGKRLLHIKVMRLESDEPLGFRRSMRRWNTLGLPTLLWTCFGLGFLLQLIDCVWAAVDRPMHQALHDKSAVTVVVQAQPQKTSTEQKQEQPV